MTAAPGGIDALVLAAAGLRRLGMASRISATAAFVGLRAGAGTGHRRDRNPRGRCEQSARRRVRSTTRRPTRRSMRNARSSKRWAADARRRLARWPRRSRTMSSSSSPWSCRSTAAAPSTARARGRRRRGRGDRRARRRAAARRRRGRHPRRRSSRAGSGRGDPAVTRATVYLIGAGPGDPGLITVRGLECLETADVVLFDHLVHARLLRHARPDAEKIDVGGAAPQPLEQEAICYLLAEKAREGKTVARLKWGDPFVFDRGGAEALFLHEQGVRFEVVPGVPAGIARAELRGHPDHLSGRRRHADVRPRPRGRRQGAGVGRLVEPGATRRHDRLLRRAAISCRRFSVRSCRTAGRPTDSAAVIYDGTLPTQETHVGSIEELLRLTRESSDRRPAILVVGRVVGPARAPAMVRRAAAVREAHPGDAATRAGGRARRAPRSDGRRSDRGADDSDPAARRLRSARRRVRASPARSTGSSFPAPTPWTSSSSACSRSRAGPARARRRQALRGRRRRPPSGSRGTASRSDLIPAEYRAEAVVRALSETVDVRGLKVLLPRADIGREIIADELRKQGADVTEVVAYRTVVAEPEREGEPDIYRMLLDRRIDVVTFTSASAVRNFVKVVGAEQSVGPPADDGRRVDRAGDGRGGGPVQHRDDDRAGAVHCSSARRCHRRAFREEPGRRRSTVVGSGFEPDPNHGTMP